jgi:hypothetical protein
VVDLHYCHAIGCKAVVPPSKFMCPYHWFMLPKSFRDKVWANYRKGQEKDKQASTSYLVVTYEARKWLATKEGQAWSDLNEQTLQRLKQRLEKLQQI